MAGVKLFLAFLVGFSVTMGGTWVDAQVHHVVGGDSGWGPSSDLLSWSSGRAFRVGDKIWFTYSAAEESIVELKSMEEYLSCDVTNPIRMYTDGLDIVPLDGEGIRYFASGNLESCKKGLKLPVEVKPMVKNETSAMALAAGPTPSGSAQMSGLPCLLFVGLFFYYVGP
ncbi:unnamed protein product [Ilex paraguariensis]|uniref:Phytocyanin domain-containing protein n=1 Tax=Ilex paraguariensis TaxID=185542 RepID=A0ABC8SLD0_9AQUA